MSRLEVLKTYKLYIGGKFPRTESGRYYKVHDKSGKQLANMCLSSRKDFRNAVVAARSAQSGWAEKTAYNRSQILYRIAEMLEGRREQFIAELIEQGATKAAATKEIDSGIDRAIYYAGWCDKYVQIFSSVNPVASSHFNFSSQEAMGVVVAVTPEDNPFLGCIETILPIIAGGNSVIVIPSESKPLTIVTFAEVLATSDLPGGVVNILTGNKEELLPHVSTHMDVNAIVYANEDNSFVSQLRLKSADNMKRIIVRKLEDIYAEEGSPYAILDLQETKTTWHPIENISPSGPGY